jgi:ribonuclease Z
MKFEVTILGTSSALPTRDRFPTSQVVNHNDRFFMIDCGEGAQIQIRKTKISFQRINHIFISHLHGDHYLGLPGLLSSMDLLGRTSDLNIYCPKGLNEFIDINLRISKSYLKFKINYIFTQPSLSELLYEDDELEIKSLPLKHRQPSTGFLFAEKQRPKKFDKKMLEKYLFVPEEIMAIKNGADYIAPDGTFYKNSEITIEPKPSRSFAFCSDTMYLPELKNYLQNVNLLYHEATFTEEFAERAKETEHSTAKQAALIAQSANVGKLIIGHFSTRYTDTDVLLNEAREIFANTETAIELKTFSID